MRSNEMTNLSTLLRVPERFRRTRTRFVRRDEFRGNHEGDDDTTRGASNKRIVTFSQNQSSSTTTTDDLPRAHVKRLMKHHLSQFTHVDSKTAQAVRTEHRERCLGWRPASVQNLYSLPDVHGERYMRGE